MCDGVKSLKSIRSYHDARLKALARLFESEKPNCAGKALNVLRTGVWFEELRGRTGHPTAYGLGQRLQPQTYQPGLHHNNLWAKYAGGKHVPGSDTVRVCEAALPGSSSLLGDVAWAALDVDRSLGDGGDALLRQLRPSIQSAIYEARELDMGRYVRRRAPTQPLRRLEGQAGLHALAALAVLLREAHECGNRSRAFEIGRSLHRTLLMAAIATKLRHINLELFDFFIRWIFPIAADDEVAMDLDRDVLLTQSYWLDRIVMQLEDAGLYRDAPGGPTRHLRQILQVNYGFDLFYGLGPRLKLCVPAECASFEARAYAATHNIGWAWGTSVLSNLRRERLMPDHVLDAQTSARRREKSQTPPT
ncbi:hypothetical protein IB242_06830 [Xanthomonas sp. XNM01]|nr:hypothetical protein [Xanthomonas sp. XNM01]